MNKDGRTFTLIPENKKAGSPLDVPYRNYIRLNVGFWSEKLRKALATLGNSKKN